MTKECQAHTFCSGFSNLLLLCQCIQWILGSKQMCGSWTHFYGSRVNISFFVSYSKYMFFCFVFLYLNVTLSHAIFITCTHIHRVNIYIIQSISIIYGVIDSCFLNLCKSLYYIYFLHNAQPLLTSDFVLYHNLVIAFLTVCQQYHDQIHVISMRISLHQVSQIQYILVFGMSYFNIYFMTDHTSSQ